MLRFGSLYIFGTLGYIFGRLETKPLNSALACSLALLDRQRHAWRPEMALMISSDNGADALAAGMAILEAGGTALDAVEAAARVVEADSTEHSVRVSRTLDPSRHCVAATPVLRMTAYVWPAIPVAMPIAAC